MRKGQKSLIIASLIPSVSFYLLFFVYPTLRAFYVSLFSWSGFTPEMTFVGLRNFAELFKDRDYWRVVSNTFGYVFIGGFLVFIIAFLFTYLIGSLKRKRLKHVIQAIIFFPVTVAPVALGIMWGFIYHRRWGLVNGILHLARLDFLIQTWMSPDLIFWSMLAVIVWTEVGFYTVIFGAAAERIPPYLYDAARVEGATNFQAFTKITLPLLKGIIRICVVLWAVWTLRIFDLIYVFAGGAAATPPLNVRSIAVQMYLLSFGERVAVFRMGYSTAIGVTLLFWVVLFALTGQVLLKGERIEY